MQGQNYPPQHQQSPAPPQQNGVHHQPSYQMNPNQPMPPNIQHSQMNQMMGALSLQSPPGTMHNLHQMGQQHQQGPGMQITQPMTFNLQSDNNQNIPVYQQR